MKILDLFFGARIDDGPLQIDAKKTGEKAGQTLGSSMAANIKKSFSGGELGKGIVQGLGLAGALGGAALLTKGLGAVTDVIGDSIAAASDLSESVSKVGVVFGDSAQDVLDWSDTAAKAMGLSKQAALEASGTIGNLLLSMGKTPPEAAKMSKSLVGLAADLASFNNVDIEEVLTAMRSGLTGEIAPLRRFGVNLTDATLKAKAMELGLSDGKEVLDVSAKSAAAYALILEQTTTAQGDYARTADGAANSQRSLNAEIEDAKAELGEKLLPIEKQWIQLQRDAIPVLGGTLDVVGNLALGFDTLADQLTRYIGFLNPFLPEQAKVPHVFDQSALHAKDFGTSLKDVADRGGRAADSLVRDIGRIETAAEKLRVNLLADATALVTDYFDVLIMKDDLAATNAELNALRKIQASRNLTAEEKANLHRLESTQAQLVSDLAAHGATQSEVVQDTLDDLYTRLYLTHGKEKKMVEAEIRRLELLAVAAKIANGEVLTLAESIAATLAKGGYITAAGAGPGPHGGGKAPGVGHNASGGPLAAGEVSWVGERGPELFVPSVRGSIIPSGPSMAMAGAGRGGDTYQITIPPKFEPRSPRDLVAHMRMLEEQGYTGKRKR